MFVDPQPDNFSTESPLRAFTDWQAGEHFAIGKGFRPSVAHLANYLSAIHTKEGWSLLQIMHADNPERMSMVFRKLPEMVTLEYKEYSLSSQPTPGFRRIGKALGIDAAKVQAAFQGKNPMALPVGEAPKGTQTDDPINPKHYAGRECADIGERLSANGYQILKYCWRLGRKDDPCQELDKAIWYAKSEQQLNIMKGFPNLTSPNKRGLKGKKAWFEERIAGQPQFTQNIARMLWQGYDAKGMILIIDTIDEQKFHLECGRGLAI